MSRYLTTHRGAAFSVAPSTVALGQVYVGLSDEDEDMAGTHLTPAEARELANRLTKEAAEVEFATKCNQAVQS